jgi:hypothetical protein
VADGRIRGESSVSLELLKSLIVTGQTKWLETMFGEERIHRTLYENVTGRILRTATKMFAPKS